MREVLESKSNILVMGGAQVAESHLTVVLTVKLESTIQWNGGCRRTC